MVIAFLDRLPEKERSLLRQHMLGRDSLVAAAGGLPIVLLHGDLVQRNVGISRKAGDETIVLIDCELAGVGNPAFDVFHFLGHFMREVSDRFELVDHYYERYLSYGGQEMDTSRWERCCNVALAHYGISFFPVYAEGFRKNQPDEAVEIVERMTERVIRAFHDLGL